MSDTEPMLYAPPPSALERPGVRDALVAAVLAGDPETFRQTLATSAPELVGQPRWYDVLTVTDEGSMGHVMVDATGTPAGADTVLAAGVPIELLNVTFGDADVTVTVGDDQWSVPRREWEAMFPPQRTGRSRR